MKQEKFDSHDGQTKAGAVAALIELGYSEVPKALVGIEPKPLQYASENLAAVRAGK